MSEQPDFQTLHDQYRPGILRFLRRMVGEVDAEDMTQVVFERANRSLSEFRGDSSMATWLYRIATNVAVDLLRSPAFRRRDASLEEVSEPDASVLAERPSNSEHQAIRNEMNVCIREVVEKLPANYRTVLILSDLEGFTPAEVAARLGLSLEAAKIRLHRARGRLRLSLEQACQFYRDDLGQLSCDRRQGDGF
ncbi:MAG: RNA polymerase sigma factor [Desulfovibrio sp.]|nr:RNA polymerase sigma factor [Desulfovibrio sp.]MBI4958818.1 RNA polymerase sigma factor [Desulfovibrio sp.]